MKKKTPIKRYRLELVLKSDSMTLDSISEFVNKMVDNKKIEVQSFALIDRSVVL